ncbi:hypothetical protein [Albidovulum sp.]
MNALGRLWREHRLALLAFAAAALVTLFFLGRLIAFTIYWSDPAHRRSAPEGWMTPGYVARSWQIPREDLVRALGLAPRPDRPATLAEIARSRGVPPAAFLAEVAATLARLEAAKAAERGR